MNCCHLHCHSTNSFLDGLTPVGDLARRVAELGQPGMALTDHGNVFGAVDFFAACTKHGIKGMIGMEAYEAVPHEFDGTTEAHRQILAIPFGEGSRYFHLTMWVTSLEGWVNLAALHSQSFTRRYKQKNQPLIDRASLEHHSEGLMIGLGCVASRTNRLLTDNKDREAYEQAKWYADTFPGRVYMEVMGNTEDQQRLIRPQRKLAQRLGVPVIATNDVHYRDREEGVENGPHHILVQARSWGKKTGDSGDKSDTSYGSWYGSDGFYLKSAQEMMGTGGLQGDEIERTVEVLERSDFDFKRDVPKPDPPPINVPPPGKDLAFDEWLTRAST